MKDTTKGNLLGFSLFLMNYGFGAWCGWILANKYAHLPPRPDTVVCDVIKCKPGKQLACVTIPVPITLGPQCDAAGNCSTITNAPSPPHPWPTPPSKNGDLSIDFKNTKVDIFGDRIRFKECNPDTSHGIQCRYLWLNSKLPPN